MKERNQGAPVDREGVVGRLDEEPAANASNLARHQELVGEPADVPDHRVREHDVELTVGEPGQVTRIAEQCLELTALLSESVQQHDSRCHSLRKIERFPVGERATDIEHDWRTAAGFERLQKVPVPAGASRQLEIREQLRSVQVCSFGPGGFTFRLEAGMCRPVGECVAR